MTRAARGISRFRSLIVNKYSENVGNLKTMTKPVKIIVSPLTRSTSWIKCIILGRSRSEKDTMQHPFLPGIHKYNYHILNEMRDCLMNGTFKIRLGSCLSSSYEFRYFRSFISFSFCLCMVLIFARHLTAIVNASEDQ